MMGNEENPAARKASPMTYALLVPQSPYSKPAARAQPTLRGRCIPTSIGQKVFMSRQKTQSDKAPVESRQKMMRPHVFLSHRGLRSCGEPTSAQNGLREAGAR